jgi:hypothetical protein
MVRNQPQRHRGHRGDGFFPGWETTAREKRLRLQRKPLLSESLQSVCGPSIKQSPAGLGSFARSSSPDRAKKKFPLCSLCLCG